MAGVKSDNFHRQGFDDKQLDKIERLLFKDMLSRRVVATRFGCSMGKIADAVRLIKERKGEQTIQEPQAIED